jgi:BASS family bile acid:Na+ symporter
LALLLALHSNFCENVAFVLESGQPTPISHSGRGAYRISWRDDWRRLLATAEVQSVSLHPTSISDEPPPKKHAPIFGRWREELNTALSPLRQERRLLDQIIDRLDLSPEDRPLARTPGSSIDMPIEKLINLLVLVTLIQLMFTIGLGVTIKDVIAVATNLRLVASAAVANYLLVPAVTLFLLWLLQSPPLVAAGFLIAASCPGAPFGPPLVGFAKGDVPVAVGLMALLAGSSAIVSPLLIGLALPLVAGDRPLTVNVVKMDETLFLTQLLPLGAGMAYKACWPRPTERLMKPSKRLSLALNIVTIGLIVAIKFPLLLAIKPTGYAAMLALTLASLGFGWLLGGDGENQRVAMAISTGVRNVGVSLAIATVSFPGSEAVTATLAYAIFQTLALTTLSLLWGRWTTRSRARVVAD